MKRALFVISTAGQGHIVRCRALASELTARGYVCTMTSKSPLSANSYDFAVVDLGDEPQRKVVLDTLDANSKTPLIQIIDEPRQVEDAADFVVCGSAGVTDAASWGLVNDGVWGVRYSLLRPEFREKREFLQSCIGHLSAREPQTLDLRSIADMSATDLARALAEAWICSDTVWTYGGMRAMEAACILGSAKRIRFEVRNLGEALNAAGLLANINDDMVDGLGCKRVADAIEMLR